MYFFGLIAGGDSSLFKNAILDEREMNDLINIMRSMNSKSNFAKGVWVIRNLCVRFPPDIPTDFEMFKNTMIWLTEVVSGEENEEILLDAVWSISQITGINHAKNFEILMNSGCWNKIVSLLKYPIILAFIIIYF